MQAYPEWSPGLPGDGGGLGDAVVSASWSVEEVEEGEGTLSSLPAEAQTLGEAVGGLQTLVAAQIHGQGFLWLVQSYQQEVAGVLGGGPVVYGLTPGVHPAGELTAGMDGERRLGCRIHGSGVAPPPALSRD